MFDKRQRITESKVARLSDNDKKEQREKVEKCLDMRGLWLHNEKRSASRKEREHTFFWIADYISMSRTKFTQSHGPPNKITLSDKTRLTFETVEDFKEWKQLINHMNLSKGIPVWDPVKKVAFEVTRIFWEEVRTDYDRIQGYVKKCCAACLRADETFYDAKKLRHHQRNPE